MEYAGAGALLARIEMIRQRLAAEGLFDADRKRPLPVLPRVIGVVTSERGAVIQDIRTTIAPPLSPPHPGLAGAGAGRGRGGADRRGDRRLRRHAGGRRRSPRPDVLIVARGGGSLEDLMAFNDEIVVRAAAACRIPLISAVGHETDTTLIDFVSDRRAPTPTAAAEMAIPARADLVADLAQKGSRLVGALHRLAQERRLRLSRVERGIPDLPALLGAARQRLDDRAERAVLALPVAGRPPPGGADLDRAPPARPANLTAAAREVAAGPACGCFCRLRALVAARRSGLDYGVAPAAGGACIARWRCCAAGRTG